VLGALDGATVLNLKVLSDPEAWDLLAKLVGVERLEAEPEAAAETIRLCGGLPLAIRIVGGTLKQKLHWSLAEYCQKLTDEKQRLAHLELSDLAVRASFELSYRELSPADGMLFSRLGILVGKDFGAELAAVVQESERPVIEGIERLIDAQLLEVNTDRRYRFHDLLRLFAREKLSASTSVEEQEGIKQQIVDWGYQQSCLMDCYLNPVARRQVVQQWIERGEVAVDYDEQVLVLDALVWYEQEREQLLSAVDWAKDRERWDTVISLAANLVPFFRARSYWQEWEKTCLMAVTAAREANDLSGEGSSLNNLGMVYDSQSRSREAIDCYQQSLTICRELGDRYGEAQILGNMGVVYDFQSRWGEAIDCYQRSLIIKRALGDRYGEAQTLGNMGMVYDSQSRWQEAIDCYQQSLTICRELGDRYGEAQPLNNMGMVYNSQSRWGEAIDCYQQSLTICREFGDRNREGSSLNNLGIVYDSQSLWGEAIDCYQQSLTIYRELGDRYGEAQSLNNLGLVYKSQSQWGEAINCYQQSLTIKRALGDRHGEAQSLNNLGNVYQSQSRWQEAIDCYQQILTICQALGDRHREGKTLSNMGVLYAKQGQLELAIPLWQEALTKLPEDAAEYPTVEGWLETARNPPIKASKQPILLLIIGSIFANLLLVNLILGHWIIAVVILGLAIGFWLLLQLWRK
jgi:tetratricopeptide (TPR) repeat protein